MPRRLDSRNSVVLVFLLILIIVYLRWPGINIIHTNTRILNRLIEIQVEQQKQNFILPKSEKEIDQEIIDRLSTKLQKNDTNTGIDIRAWFDNRPTFNASAESIDKHPFFRGFEIENSRVCKGRPVDILIYVQSATDNKEKRDIIRKTWGSTRLFHDIHVKTIFLLGMPVYREDDQIVLEMEHAIYGDIVQGKFNDTFANLSHKAITALVWMNRHCSHAKTIFKTDDDIFVDIHNVVRELIPLLDKGNQSIICDIVNNSEIVRDPKNKYYINPKYLPSATRYPTFCSGYFVLMSGNLAPIMYERSFQPDKFVPIDDAYVFGVLTDGMAKMAVTNVHQKVSHLKRPDPQQEIKTNGKFEYFAFAAPNKAVDIWNMKLQKLTDWERSHSLYVKLFETSGKKTVIIE